MAEIMDFGNGKPILRGWKLADFGQLNFHFSARGVESGNMEAQYLGQSWPPDIGFFKAGRLFPVT